MSQTARDVLHNSWSGTGTWTQKRRVPVTPDALRGRGTYLLFLFLLLQNFLQVFLLFLAQGFLLLLHNARDFLLLCFFCWQDQGITFVNPLQRCSI